MTDEFLMSLMRAASLACRLALSVFVVAELGVGALATLSLLQAVAGFAPPLLAMGLHYRTNRGIVDAPVAVMAQRLCDRMLLNGLMAGGLALTFGLAAVLADSLLSGLGLSARILCLFLAICVLEVVLADAQNYLISCRRAVLAGFVLFTRNAAWVPPMMLAVWGAGWSGLEPVLWFWLAGAALAFCVMAAGLSDWPWRDALRAGRGLRWQFDGFPTAMGIWLSDVSVAGTPVVERTLLVTLLGTEVAGGYIFFWTLANGVLQVVTSAVVFPSVPMLVAAGKGDPGQLQQLSLRLCMRALLYSAGFGAVVLGGAAALLPWLERPELAGSYGLLPLLIGGFAIVAVTEVLRLALYALKRDRALVQSNIAMVALNTALVGMAAAFAGPLAVAVVPALVAAGISALRWHWIAQERDNAHGG